MAVDLNKYSLEELYDLNKRIVSQIKALQREIAKEKSSSFRIGQAVWFVDRYGRRVEGILERFMPKNLAIKVTDETDGRVVNWKVSPHLVKAVEPSKHEVDPIDSLGGEAVDSFPAHISGADKPRTGHTEAW